VDSTGLGCDSGRLLWTR